MNKELSKKYFFPAIIITGVMLLGFYLLTGISPFTKFEFAAVILAVIASWHQLFIKPIPLVVRLVLVAAVAGLIFWPELGPYFNSGNSNNSKPITYSPIANVQWYIQTYLKEEYWPAEYKAEQNYWYNIQGFGKDKADNYGMMWEKDGMSFVLATGDLKGPSEKPLGFYLHVNIEGKQPLGYESADRFFKNIPKYGWKQTEPYDDFAGGNKVQYSSVVWKDGNTSLDAEVEYEWYASPRDGLVIPTDKFVKELTVISIEASEPDDPLYKYKSDLSNWQCWQMWKYTPKNSPSPCREWEFQ